MPKKIQFLVDWQGTHKKGDIVNVDNKGADAMVKNKWAKYVLTEEINKGDDTPCVTQDSLSSIKHEDTIKDTTKNTEDMKAQDTHKYNINEAPELAKQILDKYITRVIKKDAVFAEVEEGKWGIDQHKAENYVGTNYSKDMVLMYTPLPVLRIEFEDSPELNRNYINYIESQAKTLGFDFCITEHEGAKSPYFNMFDLPFPDDAQDWKPFKLMIVNLLMPDKIEAKLDKTNLGMTLTPIIGHSHWKPKYNGAIHKIVRGKNPLEHNNNKKEVLLKLIKKVEKAKKKVHTIIADIKGKDKWVEKFLLDYCLNNKLPSGQRNSIICKNLAIFISFREDKQEIINKFMDAQEYKKDEVSPWLIGVYNNIYQEVGVGELKNYIISNEIPFTIKNYELSTEETITDFLQDVNNPYHNIENLYKKNPFFYDVNGLYWFWDNQNKCWEIKDDVDVMNIIGNAFRNNSTLVDSQLVNQYIKAIQMIGRQRIPKEPNKKWIQFKDKIYDIENNIEFESTPEYFFTNPLPFAPAKTSDCKQIDKLFTEWNKDQKEIMYEIIAYCCLMDYPLHFIFMLEGIGSNGKSKFQKIIRRFIDYKKNCCSVDLDILVDNRFESAKLYKKLVCLMGETNFGVMNKTNKLKALTGQDLVGIEFKNKQPFDTVNYAKIIIASNSLPMTEDNTDGFFRRWLIINFPNQFPEGACPIDLLPDSEFEKLSRKCIEILPKLLQKAEFTKQGTIAERKKKYIMVSNPLPEFIKDMCILNQNSYTRYSELYTAYACYLDNHKKRIIGKKAFSEALDREAILVEKNTKYINGNPVSDRWVIGLVLKPDWKENQEMTEMTKMTAVYLSSPIRELSENFSTRVISVISEEKNQENDNSVEVTEEKIEEIPQKKDLITTNDVDSNKNNTTILDLITTKLTKQPIEIEIFKNEFKNYEIEVFDSAIETLKQKGDIIENPAGYIAKLE